jgi:isopropylmalate/homocitrate/citramalate synthase
MTTWPTSGTMVRVVEVGPRDGLQNEHAPIAARDKIGFVNRLAAAGLRTIEVTSFVSPRWVPQMADAEDVARGIERRAGTTYSALVPNLAGFERARAAGIDEIAIVAAASDTFSRRNINLGVQESLAAYRAVADAASEAGIRVRGYLSTSFGCPYEGEVPPSRVAEVSGQLLALGAFEVVLSDTIGIAHPGQVRAVVDAVGVVVPIGQTALHVHDTRGTGLANVLMALSLGVTTFDSSAGGLGGCPYAPGAAGNLATEDLVYMLDGLGVRTGVDLDGVVAASRFIEPRVGHPLASRVYQAQRRAALRGSADRQYDGRPSEEEPA